MQPLHELTGVEAAQAIAAGTITSEALVTACLERITAREESVRAWEYLAPEAALAQAQARDHSPAQGPLHGVPVGIKDLIDTSDMPTSYGSPIYAGHRPAWDAASVALLRAAGAVILGKTVTTEFAMFTPGKTANPHNVAHTPGGSSSGSAAAVADRWCRWRWARRRQGRSSARRLSVALWAISQPTASSRLLALRRYRKLWTLWVALHGAWQMSHCCEPSSWVDQSNSLS